ncbi:MAG: ABC transporter permease [Cyclobacteriaceae bacterium]
MLGSYIKIAFRHLLKNRIFSLINISGLSIGLTAFFLIMLYVRFELSYDDFHNNSENIYRIATKVTLQNEVINHESNTYEGIVRALREEVSDVRAVTVISAFNSDGAFLRFEDSQKSIIPFSTFKGCYADESFFSVFSFPLLTGDQHAVLKKPYSAVISQTLASTYFANDAVGKILEFTDDDTGSSRLTITGIMNDVPPNSHLQFDLVINLLPEEGDFWTWTGHAYMLLGHEANPKQIERKLDALATDKNGLKKDPGDFRQVSKFKLQPLNDIHLFSNLDYEFERGGNNVLVYSLLILAVIIVVIAWVNYVNLSTAISSQKVREIGVRKVVGASKSALTLQVLTESALFNFHSLSLAVILSWLLLPAFSDLLNLPVDATVFLDGEICLAALAFMTVSTLVAGGYPAFLIASMYTVRALKGKSAGSNYYFRKGLVVFQFSAAIVLMIITTVAYRQLSFMRGKELGINIEQVLVIKALNFDKESWSDRAGGYVVDSLYQQKALLFKNDLRKHPEVINATSLSHLPGQMPVWGTEFMAKDIDLEKATSLKAIGIDYDFLPAFQVKLLAGRNFSLDFPSDQGNEYRRAVLINETASRLLGFKTAQEAVSRHITTYWGADYEIIGVVKSFHQLSLKENLTPLYFILQPRALSYFAVNFQAGDLANNLSKVEASWHRHFPDYPFNYVFLDQYFDRQYQNEQQFGKVVLLFTALAVFIGCMGLFGLTAYAIVQRTKEIGIRKVLGATVASVIVLFSSDFLRLILISNIIAIPLAYVGIGRWLDNYAFKISLEWWLFMLPTTAILAIAFLTVSLQTIKLAQRNPVESLKYE